MSDKLELKHLAPYLPYELILRDPDLTEPDVQFDLIGLRNGLHFDSLYWHRNKTHAWEPIGNLHPVFRPLSDLTKEIKHNGERFVFVEALEIGDDDSGTEFDVGNVKTITTLKTIAEHNVWHDVHYLPHLLVQDLLKYHFDVFGLIEKGLAVDINTLEHAEKE